MNTMDLIVQHPVYRQLLKFTSGVESREKLLRLLQYFVRFLRYVRFHSVLTPDFIRLLPELQKAFTVARKPLRCLKPLNHFKLFAICMNDELSDSILRYSEALKQFGLFGFFSFDAIQWLKMLGLIKGNKNKFIKNVNKYAAGMWCLSIVGGLIKNLRQIEMLINNYKENRKHGPEGDKEIKIPTISADKVKRDVIKNVLDFVIALNLYKDLSINDGIIGGFGTITSILAIQDLWKSAKV